MLTKNLTPFLYAARSTSLRPPKPAMSIVVRASFAIGDDGALTPVLAADARQLSADTYREEDDDCLGGCVHPSDFADYKTRSEVLLKGSCHAPHGQPVTECAARIQVGKWSKSLRVVGRRIWGGAPAPFTSSPLDWEHAYGGPTFARNPSGRGFDGDEMPTVLNAKDALRSRGENAEPASFGAINPRWPLRAAKLGKEYDETYRKTRAPYFAVDMDPTFFMESAADQWLEGYLSGDEAVVLQNLHPRVPLLVVNLPSLRPRTFFLDDAKVFREIETRLDTLYVDLDAHRLELSWRGAVDVREEDLADITTLLIASESLNGPTESLAHYDAIAAAHEADPVGLSQLPPKGSAAEAGDNLTVAALLDSKLGKAQPAQVQELAPLLDKGIAHTASTDARVKEALSERSEELKPGPQKGEAPPPRVIRPGGFPFIGLRRHVREMIAKAVDARTRALEKGATPEQLGKLTTVEEIANDPRWLTIEPAYTPPEPLSTDAPGPGANLVDRDLREFDLRGADLTGANLEGAILTGARLNGAILKGARLYGTVLYRADLSDADLTGADLTRANGAFAILRGAKLDGSNLTEAFFEDADLEGASLTSVEGAYAVFTRATLKTANLRGAKLSNAEIDDAELSSARFDGADLSRTRFQKSRCDHANFSSADLQKASFEGAVLDDARLFDAKADGIILASASAKRAIFAFARMRRAFMDRFAAPGADFHGADLRDARMHRVNLVAAKVTSANLFAADLWKAQLDGARLTKSNLYQANLTLASIQNCDLSGANLKKSSLESA